MNIFNSSESESLKKFNLHNKKLFSHKKRERKNIFN